MESPDADFLAVRCTKDATFLQYAVFAGRLPAAEALQLVRDLRQEERRGSLHVTDAARWLAGLDA